MARTDGATRTHAPFEIELSALALRALQTDLTQIAFEDRFNTLWLRDRQGNTFALNVQSRDVEPRFEVFSIEIATIDEVTRRALDRRSEAKARGDLPDVLQTRWENAPLPEPPSSFEPWPFEIWTVQSLRRAEFIVEDVAVDNAFGQGPYNFQSATRPGQVPADACAICEVDVGLLFTGADGSQLLVAVDWQPFAKLISRDPGEIRKFLETSRTTELNGRPSGSN